MTEDEYDALMKKALTNELHWHGLTATPVEAREARDWLEETLLRVKRDFEYRKAEMQIATARHPKRTREYWQELEKYETWMWEDYPEIGENDWLEIRERLSLAYTFPTHTEFRVAYEHLAERADGDGDLG